MAEIVTGKQVVVELDPGGTIEGYVVSVNATELRMKVSRSKDARFSSNNEHAIPRSAITRLQLIERGRAGRILGTIAGAVGGFFLGAAIFDEPDNIARGLGGAVGGAAAGAVGGFILGARLDRRITTIRLLPD